MLSVSVLSSYLPLVTIAAVAVIQGAVIGHIGCLLVGCSARSAVLVVADVHPCCATVG